jgi:hypothetical protein
MLMGEGGEGVGEEPNRTTSRKPGPLLIMASNKDTVEAINHIFSLP